MVERIGRATVSDRGAVLPDRRGEGERLPSIRLNSQELTPEVSFARWQALLPQYSIRLPTGHDIRDFSMDAAAWLLDPLVVMAGRTTSAWVNRVASQSGAEEANLVFVLFAEGRWIGEADGRSFDFGDGELIGLDAARPSTGLSTDSHWIMINIPRRALGKLVSAVPDLHGHVFRSASAALLCDHMMALARHLPKMRVEESERVTQASLSLIAATLDELAGRTGANEATSLTAIRMRVERHVQQNIGTAHLTPRSICEELGIARSSLYRAFASVGGVAAFVSERRLETARAILFHPEDHRATGEIASLLGFPSTASFSKAFTRRFGCSPRVARATGATPGPVIGRHLFSFWEDVLAADEPSVGKERLRSDGFGSSADH